ncbi:catalase [Tetragenococcus halophilus]|uniref:catalase n=1 Tax=Tetragenococcus halophilus TaxID=51669 RepID=UPI00255FA6AB|nr:catalase [Tetragenococcus halophilus]GMG69449.1 catalase [Tetragenococcus halophilus]
MEKDPMAKNGLDSYQSSRNQNVGNNPELQTNAGAPVFNNDNTMTAGERGPSMLQDVWLLEKLADFNREVIPERRMHAKGSGAFGTFTVTHDITKYTKAKIFSEIGKQTEMFARFSTVAGERGAADAERDIRGFALKFYTEEGNWDLVGNNTPVFFHRDPKHFIDLNRAIKRDPRTNMRSPNNNWDFWTSLPESLHQVTITMSDRGIPSSYRFMHGFSSHAYSLINADNERVWVKFYFRSQQGIQNLTDQEADIVNANTRESHQADLYNAIEQGKYPKWKMYIQVMTQEEANQLDYNPFDLTKVWYKEDFPLMEVGEFELNKNPDNYFQDVEEASFNPAAQVPGIGISPDRMLQTRVFAYQDAARYRIGVNHHQIPVNAPRGVKNPHPYSRDGQGRMDGNLGSEVHYTPNSYGNYTDHKFMEEPTMQGGDVKNYDFREDDHDYYTQPGMLFRRMTEEQQLVLFENTARNMGDSTLQIKHRHINNCYQADPDYGAGVAKALGIDLNDVDLTPTPRDSEEANDKANARGHKDLNVPTEPAMPETAKDLGPEGRDTNVEDPFYLTDPMNDPFLL